MRNKGHELEKDENGFTIMNQKNLSAICERDELFSYPELNEKLQLTIFLGKTSIQGFDKIENLSAYYNLCALWLNNNGFTKIEGLDGLTKLATLFLNHNLISRIEGLSSLSSLATLNLSNNRIKQIEGLSGLTSLNNLNLSFNLLQTVQDISLITECPSLSNVDLSNNHICYDEKVLDIFIELPQITCLYLKGNQIGKAQKHILTRIVREFPYYRKKFVGYLKMLKYLDEKPILEQERRICEAWIKEGKDGEQSERQKISEERRADQLKAYQETEERVLKAQEMKQDYLKREQDKICMKIIDLQKKLDMNDDDDELRRLIEEEEEKLRDLEQNIDNVVIEKVNPYNYISVTRDANDNIVILNKSEEDQKYIKQNIYNEEIAQMSKSQTELQWEEVKKQRQKQIVEQIEREETNENQEGIEDQNKKDKEFMIKKQQPPVQEPVIDERDKQLEEWKILRQGWSEQDDEQLEKILINNQFDFDSASIQFELWLQKENKNRQYTSTYDLQRIWTYIELSKFRNKQIQIPPPPIEEIVEEIKFKKVQFDEVD